MTGKPIDPLALKFCEPRYFEDFAVGERFYLPSRTMTEGVFSAFQAASGDNHPIHYDRHYCQAQGHRDLLAHGFQVLIQACIGAGVLPQMMGPSLIGFIERFTKPGNLARSILFSCTLSRQRLLQIGNGYRALLFFKLGLPRSQLF